MFSSGRGTAPPNDEDTDPRQQTPSFRSMATVRPPVDVGTRLRSTESSKSQQSHSDAGSFWGLGPVESVGSPPTSEEFRRMAPPSVMRGSSSLSAASASSAAVFRSPGVSSPLARASSSSSSSSTSSSSSAWKVTADSLRPVPPFFPVERTHAVLEEKETERRECPVSAVADRIVRCLESLSIAAVYDDERAMALATTADRCRFYIRLFKVDGGTEAGQDDVDNEGWDEARDEEKDGEMSELISPPVPPRRGSVLLELQRRRGSCLSFRAAAREILRAAKGSDGDKAEAEGKEVEDREDNGGSLSCPPPPRVGMCPYRCPPGVIAAAARDETDDKAEKKEDEEKDSHISQSLANITRLLSQEGGRIDARLLAFESLRCALDPDGCGGEETARQAAHALMVGSDGCQEALVQALLVGRGRTTEQENPQESDDDENYEGLDDDDDDEGGLDARYLEEMRGLALSALARSLEATAADEASSREELMATIPVEDLIHPLLDDVLRLSSIRPCDAAEAARCLRALVQMDIAPSSSWPVRDVLEQRGAPDMLHCILKKEVRVIAEGRRKVGGRQESYLAREVGKLIGALKK